MHELNLHTYSGTIIIIRIPYTKVKTEKKITKVPWHLTPNKWQNLDLNLRYMLLDLYSNPYNILQRGHVNN